MPQISPPPVWLRRGWVQHLHGARRKENSDAHGGMPGLRNDDRQRIGSGQRNLRRADLPVLLPGVPGPVPGRPWQLRGEHRFVNISVPFPDQEPLEQQRIPTDPDPAPDAPVDPFWGDPDRQPGRGEPAEDPDPAGRAGRGLTTPLRPRPVPHLSEGCVRRVHGPAGSDPD